MDALKKLEAVLGLLAEVSEQVEQLAPDGTAVDSGARAAELLIKIAASAVQAHNKVSTEPMDVSKLHDLPHV